jgi:hypothetical protein
VSIAALFNVPRTENELSQWAFAHMASHRDIIRVIYQLGAVALPEYLLDPINPNETGTWERQHQEMHQQMNALLGLDGFDLLGLDWDDQNKLASWVLLNAVEHRQASDLLRLG